LSPKQDKQKSASSEDGGAEGIRTPDPHNAIVVLYQLSYDPINQDWNLGRAGTLSKTFLSQKSELRRTPSVSGASRRYSSTFGLARRSLRSGAFDQPHLPDPDSACALHHHIQFDQVRLLAGPQGNRRLVSAPVKMSMTHLEG
jgi:hypothetical protein